MSDAPKIFISWSTAPSGEIAVALQTWLKRVFPEVESFLSSEDINAGTLPMERIRGELTASSCGILVITAENQERQWINFEAGSLFRTLGSEKGRVIPLLVDLEPSDLRGPMGLLQTARLNESELLDKLVPSLCNSFEIKDTTNRQEMGRAFLEQLMGAVDQARSSSASTSAPAPDLAGMIAEVLSIVRSMAASDLSARSAYATTLTDLMRRSAGLASIADLASDPHTVRGKSMADTLLALDESLRAKYDVQALISEAVERERRSRGTEDGTPEAPPTATA